MELTFWQSVALPPASVHSGKSSLPGVGTAATKAMLAKAAKSKFECMMSEMWMVEECERELLLCELTAE